MAPIIQDKTAEEKILQPSIGKRSDLLCKIKFTNNLPDIPSDLKFLSNPLDPKRYTEYKLTSLEKSYKYENLTDYHVGNYVDLVNKDAYKNDDNDKLENADEKLLEEEVVSKYSNRSKNHAKNVSWLRRPERISTKQTRFQLQAMEKTESKVGFNAIKNFKVEDTIYMNKDRQMEAIEKTFEDNKIPIEKHYSKPNVHAVETLNVFPDFKNWKYSCAHVIFDSSPVPMNNSKQVQKKEISQAMIRGVIDENGDPFAGYFLPFKETLDNRHADAMDNRSYDEDYKYEYTMAKDYNWIIKNKKSKGVEDNYFLTVQKDGIFYNELETRVCLNKRRTKTGMENTNTRLTVQYVPITENELNAYKLREKQLQPYNEEDKAKSEIKSKKLIIGNSINNTAGSDSDVSDKDDEKYSTVNSKRINGESDEHDMGHKLKQSCEARSDTENGGIKTRNKRSPGYAASEAYTETLNTDE